MSWNTLPLRNGAYEVAAAAVYEGPEGPIQVGVPPTDGGVGEPGASQEPLVKNLVISHVSTPDYFPREREQTTAQDITFTIEDDDLDDAVDVVVAIYPTRRGDDLPASAIRTLTTRVQPGGTSHQMTVSWDGQGRTVDDQGLPGYGFVEPGLYTYDIWLSQPADQDAWHYRSDLLRVAQSHLIVLDPLETAVEVAGSNDNPVDWEATGDEGAADEGTDDVPPLRFHFTYALTELPKPGTAEVHYWRGLAGLTTPHGPYDGLGKGDDDPVVQEYLPSPTGLPQGSYFAVVAEDTHADQYRHHQPKRLLPRNQWRPEVWFDVYMAMFLSGDPETPSTFQIRWRKRQPFYSPSVVHWTGEWHVAAILFDGATRTESYNVVSGEQVSAEADYRNSRSYVRQWWNSEGGPVPLNRHVSQNVSPDRTNSDHTALVEPYRLGAVMSNRPTDGAGNFISFPTFTIGPDGASGPLYDRWRIHNRADGDRHTPINGLVASGAIDDVPEDKRFRRLIRLHYTGSWTEGCIGVLNEQSFVRLAGGGRARTDYRVQGAIDRLVGNLKATGTRALAVAPQGSDVRIPIYVVNQAPAVTNTTTVVDHTDLEIDLADVDAVGNPVRLTYVSFLAPDTNH